MVACPRNCASESCYGPKSSRGATGKSQPVYNAPIDADACIVRPLRGVTGFGPAFGEWPPRFEGGVLWTAKVASPTRRSDQG